MQHKRAPLRVRLHAAGQALFRGQIKRDYIPALSPLDGWPDMSGRLKSFLNKSEQLEANLGLCYTANNAITEVAAAVQLKAGRRNKKTGEIEEAFDDKALQLMELLNNPNNVHSGEQLMDLHYSYRNFTGEAYTWMFKAGREWTPIKGQLPDALQEVPAHAVHFELSKAGYSKSTVRMNGTDYPITQFLRDIKPDPANPYNGISVIRAGAAMINNDQEMREWNNRLIANGAAPSLIFTTKTSEGGTSTWMDDEAFKRWEQQFTDEHTGAANAGKPLLIENGDVKPFTMTPEDLEFLASRQFTNEEILMMWRVNPYIIGSVKDVNRASAIAADIQHAKVNIAPRVRQWVHQLQVTMVNVFDPDLILFYDPIVPDDEETKRLYHVAAANKWETIDEARGAYGEEPLPDGLGAQIYISDLNAPLSAIADGSARQTPAAGTDPGSAATDPNEPDDGTADPGKDGKSYSPAGVKKKPLTHE